jgi:O-antigen ligase
MTFSNRAVIWDIIKEHIQLAPVLGSGYGAYWTGPVPSSPSYTFLSRMYFYPTQSHNGYLEIVNDLGFAGLICLLGYLVSWVYQSLQLMKFERGQGMLFLALFFQQAITNLSESTWLALNSGFAFALVTLATFSLSRSLLDQRLRLYFRAPGAAGPR